MTTNLKVNDQFPDIELPDQQNELRRLSQFTRPGLLDQQLGFLDTILWFFFNVRKMERSERIIKKRIT